MKLADMPAFPGDDMLSSGQPGARRTLRNDGMTYRQWLAGMLMQGLRGSADQSSKYLAEFAVKDADALIAELEKQL